MKTYRDLKSITVKTQSLYLFPNSELENCLSRKMCNHFTGIKLAPPTLYNVYYYIGVESLHYSTGGTEHGTHLMSIIDTNMEN